MKLLSKDRFLRNLPHLVLPTPLTAKGKTYPIAVVRGLNDAKGISGYISWERGQRGILIEAENTPEEREVSLVHEMVHAVWPHRLHKLNGQVLKGKDEEDFVHALDGPLTAALRDNNLPRLFGEMHAAARAIGASR